MKFFAIHSKAYPLSAIFISVFITIIGLIIAKDLLTCSLFCASLFVFFAIYGFYKECLKILPIFIFISGLFFLFYYLATNEITPGWAMANRFAALFVAIIPSMGTSPIRMTRNLNSLHFPKAITLGMLIAMSFMPLLKQEIKRVRGAMKTRGAYNILNPKIFYRAFLIPLRISLINISDTLSLSIETRGFSLDTSKNTVYKKEFFVLSDAFFLLAVISGGISVLIL